MKPKNLQSLLERLDSALSDFSYEQLNADEASQLRSSFQTFKDALRGNVSDDKSAVQDIRPKSFERQSAAASRNKVGSKAHESRLIAHVSHEIRTPLNGILGFSDLLKEGRLDQEQLDQVDAIQSASYAMLDIVNELLEYSKLALGLEKFQQIEFNLFGLIRDVMFLCNTLVTSNKVTLTSNIAQEIPEMLIGDTSKLTQVLLNVIGNAIKFAEEGEVHLGVTELEQKDGKHVLEFEISDNGIGIAKDKINSVFDPFKQAEEDTYAKYGGNGLGLTIVRQIIENLGGSIKLTSNLGTGTTINFTMPFERSLQKPAPDSISDTQAEEAEIKLRRGFRVLVFEDNILNQRLIAQRLEAWQCHIHITDNGHYGMGILEENDIDVVLMDLRMPGMTGFEVTQLIRGSGSQRIRQVPIIALTADYTIRDRKKFNSLGINDYLLKPFSPEELLKKLVAIENPGAGSTVSGILAQPKGPISKGENSLVNLDGMLEECMHDLCLLEELTLLFKHNNTEFVESAKIHLHNEDMDGLAFSAHKIRAGMEMIKANGLLTIIEDILIGCNRHPDWNQLEFLYVRFLNDYPKVEEAIDRVIEDLKES